MPVVLSQEDCLSGTGDLAYDLGAGVTYPGFDGSSAGDGSRGVGHNGIF